MYQINRVEMQTKEKKNEYCYNRHLENRKKDIL